MDEPEWAAPDLGAADGPRPSADRPTTTATVRAPIRLPVPLRPMTMPDLLDGSFAVIKARPKTVFALAAAILIPFHLLAAFLQRGLAGFSLSTGFGQQSTTSASAGTQIGAVLLGYVGVALISLAPFFLGGALAKVVTAWYAGSDLSAGDALRATWRRAPALVGAFGVLLPLKVMGLMFCLVGAIPVVTLFVLTAPVITVEGLGPIAAAQRSWRLVSRRFWPCLAVVVVASIGAYVLTTIFGSIPEVLTSLLPAPFNWLARGLVQALVSMVVTTALVAVSVLLYLDLRIRTEGLDLELEAADVFARHG
ncbi:MAG TPA: hypothetical protein VIJ47_13710 [Acidimicrobiales bacterium]